MRRVLVVMPYAGSSFMEDDVRLLERHATVETIVSRTPFDTLARVRRALGRLPDVVLLWFAHPSYAWGVVELARRRRVPAAVVTGGYDVASMPELEFGAMRKRRNRPLVRRALERADVVLPFSESAAREVRRWARPRKLQVLYPAVDTDVFRPDGAVAREPLVATASAVSRLFVRQKGLDTFLAVAARVPDARFVLVGRDLDGTLAALRRTAPRNVVFVSEYLQREELVWLFRRARAYVQASAHEGFGLAVAESMACGAIPIGSRGTALEEVIGDSGHLIEYGDVDACVAAVRAALAAPEAAGATARARVVERFGLARRERELVLALEGLRAN